MGISFITQYNQEILIAGPRGVLVIRKLRSFGVPIKHKRFLNDTLAMLKNVACPNTTTGKKNADITLLIAKEIFSNGEYEAFHVRTQYNTSDILASPRGGEKFRN